MPHVIAEPCLGTKDRSCVEACPVACIRDAGEQLVIDPDGCVDCGACIPACPVSAIFAEQDLPLEWAAWRDLNREEGRRLRLAGALSRSA